MKRKIIQPTTECTPESFSKIRRLTNKYFTTYKAFEQEIEKLIFQQEDFAAAKTWLLSNFVSKEKNLLETKFFEILIEKTYNKITATTAANFEFLEKIEALIDSLGLSTKQLFLFGHEMLSNSIVLNNDELFASLKQHYAKQGILPQILAADTSLLEYFFDVNDGNNISQLLAINSKTDSMEGLKEPITQLMIKKISKLSLPHPQNATSILKYQSKNFTQKITSFFQRNEPMDVLPPKKDHFETNFFLSCLVESLLRNNQIDIIEDVLNALDAQASATFVCTLLTTSRLVSIANNSKFLAFKSKEMTLEEEESNMAEKIVNDINWLVQTHEINHHTSILTGESFSSCVEIDPISS